MEERECKQCHVYMPLDIEHFESQKEGQFNHTCRECRSEYYNNWRKEKQNNNPEYLREKALKELYHTTVEWYEEKLKEQGGHCALCTATQFTHRKRLGVDHKHSCCPKRGCGKCNRGILCATCNYRVGQVEAVLKEGTIVPVASTWLALAVAYIDSYKRKENE